MLIVQINKQSLMNSINYLPPAWTLNEVHHHGQNYTDYLNRNVLSNFEFHEINDDITKKIIHEFKSSCSSGHDGLNSELLKLIGGSNYDSLIVRTVAFPVQVAYWIKRS